MNEVERLREAYVEKEKAQEAYFQTVRDGADIEEAEAEYRNAVRVFQKRAVDLARSEVRYRADGARRKFGPVLEALAKVYESYAESAGKDFYIESVGPRGDAFTDHLKELVEAYDAWLD